MTKKILSICFFLLLITCFSISQTYAAEPGNIVDTIHSSSEQEATFDDSDREDNKLTEEEKSKPKDQLIKDFVSQVDYSSCLNYNYYTKSINEDGKNNLYLIHIITYNYNNYLKLAKKFDIFFSKIAVSKEKKTLLDQETNKKLYYLSKNYQEIDKNLKDLPKINPEGTAYRINKGSSMQLPNGWYGVVTNTTSVNCYQFYDKNDEFNSKTEMNSALKDLKHTLEITFIAESATKDAFDSELARNTVEIIIDNKEMLAPVFTNNNGWPYCILLYKQKLNVPAVQTETVQGITGRYELTKVKGN